MAQACTNDMAEINKWSGSGRPAALSSHVWLALLGRMPTSDETKIRRIEGSHSPGTVGDAPPGLKQRERGYKICQSHVVSRLDMKM